MDWITSNESFCNTRISSNRERDELHFGELYSKNFEFKSNVYLSLNYFDFEFDFDIYFKLI